jgi:uncharacterized protein (DUF362 family)
MTRREFLERAAALAILGAITTTRLGRLLALQRGLPDLAAVKGGALDLRLARGLEAIGGMGRFVAAGSVVAVKPNIGWDVLPELGATTDPRLVAGVVRACLAAGAKKVYVFDHSCDEGSACYKTSGIEKAAREAGARVAPANAQAYYQQVEFRGGRVLSSARVHELVLEADVLINLPILKSHGGAGMTAALKNLMGAVWDREAFHARGLDAAIADIGLAVRPALTVLDAGRVMLTGGPRGTARSRYAETDMLLLSSDMVAVDAAAAKVFGSQASAFPYIGEAANRGLGRVDLEGLDIRRVAL